jgi:AAA+ superfamily predicted ATPase
MITVRFEFSTSRNSEKIFFQPLFFISMNLKHQILKKHNKEYDNDLIDENLSFFEFDEKNDNKHLEIISSSLSSTDFKLNYILDRYDTNMRILYKGTEFKIKSDKKVSQFSIKLDYDEFTVSNTYEISYADKDVLIFEDLMKASLVYFKKNANWNKDDKNRMKMFIISNEGEYFEHLGSRQRRSLDSVFLPHKQKTAIINVIHKFIQPETIQQYKKLGINHKLTILLEGVPGTGKSSLISAIASHFKFNIALMNFTPKMTDVGFLKSMRTWERKISDSEENENTILVIEDMDCIFKERKSNDESRNMITFSGILNGLDGISTSEHQIVFITTNHIEYLDPALIRPGRVDYIMRFDYATKEQIIDIFKVYATTGISDTPIIEAALHEDQAQAQQVQAQHIAQQQAQAQHIAQEQAQQAQQVQQAQHIDASDIDAEAKRFYNEIKTLDIKITTSLLQQYLLKYINNTAAIIKNIDELKQMYDACNQYITSEKKGLYN